MERICCNTLYLSVNLEPSSLRRYLRRGIALLILTAYAASAAEAVVGVVRDGQVHHESALTAAVHRAAHVSQHGYEHLARGSHDTGHEPGAPSDHCTHVHGVSLPTLCHFELVAPTLAARERVVPLTPSDVVPTPRLRPPIG